MMQILYLMKLWLQDLLAHHHNHIPQIHLQSQQSMDNGNYAQSVPTQSHQQIPSTVNRMQMIDGKYHLSMVQIQNAIQRAQQDNNLQQGQYFQPQQMQLQRTIPTEQSMIAYGRNSIPINQSIKHHKLLQSRENVQTHIKYTQFQYDALLQESFCKVLKQQMGDNQKRYKNETGALKQENEELGYSRVVRHDDGNDNR